MATRSSTSAAGIAALRRLRGAAARAPGLRAESGERSSGAAAGAPRLQGASGPKAATEPCELCGGEIPPAHRHLLEMPARRIVCVCDACATCFQGVTGGRYRLVPRDARRLADFAIGDEQWQNLALPIDLAFFFFDSAWERTVALYPGPAGAVESALDLAAWNEIGAAHPAVRAMQPDVEALIANRTGRAEPRYFIAPIDACFRLTGLIRLRWRGLSGGGEVWREVAKFFAELDPRATRAEAAARKEAYA